MGLNKVGTMMKTINVYCVSALCLMALSLNCAYAEWGSPVVVVNGGWGTADSEFDLSIGDSVIKFPLVTDVSSAGEIAITDERNGRVKIYRSDGNLKNLLVPPVSNPRLKTYIPFFIGSNVTIATSSYFFYSATGNLIVERQRADGRYFSYDSIGESWFLTRKKDANKFWLEYSPTGELLNMYTEKPLVMGRYSKDIVLYAGDKLQQTIIDYPGVTWVRVDENDRCTEYDYIRDGSSNVYCKLEKSLKRFNACGRVVSEFTMPEDDLVEQDVGNLAEPIVTQINALYGDIVLADNGDVYTSRSATSGYQAVRFSWQASANDRNDGPFAPEGLAAQVNGSDVTLTWDLSPHDAGCVSGYEVGRATTAGGSYTALATVAQSASTHTDSTAQAGTTYYYAVRATSSINVSSPYSNEASAQVP